MQVAAAEGFVLHEHFVEGHVMADAADSVFTQCAAHLINGLQACGTPGAQFRDHGIVEHRHFATFVNAAVITNAWPRGRSQEADLAGTGHEILVRIFGVDAALHGPAIELDFALGEGQFLAASHQNLPFHQVKTRDPFGNRMLHLQSRVHLQEVEIAVRICQEFHGTRTHVLHGPRHFQRSLAHGGAHLWRDMGTGGLLDDFLVPPLNGAFAFPHVDVITVLISEDLNLDVPGLVNRFFDVDAVITKGRKRLAPGTGQSGLQFLSVFRQPHALATTAHGGLHHDGIADLLGFQHQSIIAHGFLDTRHHGASSLDGHDPRRGFRAHANDGFRPGTDEGDAVLFK